MLLVLLVSRQPEESNREPAGCEKPAGWSAGLRLLVRSRAHQQQQQQSGANDKSRVLSGMVVRSLVQLASPMQHMFT